MKVEYNDDSDESAIDDLCDQHGDDDADGNDGGLAETGGEDFQWLFKMLATMGTLIRIMGTLMRTIRIKGMMGMMGMMVMMGVWPLLPCWDLASAAFFWATNSNGKAALLLFMVVMMMITVVLTMKAIIIIIMILSDNDKIMGISFRRNSDHCLVLAVCQSVNARCQFCSNFWICQSCYMDIPNLLNGFVKMVTWISHG